MKKTFNGRFESPEEPRKGTGWLVAGLVMIPLYSVPFAKYLFIAASIFCFVRYGKFRKEYKLYEHFHAYCAVIGSRTSVGVKELSKVSQRDKPDVRKDLQTMISRGYFGPDASFDVAGDCLVLPGGATASASHGQRERSGSSWADVAMELLNSINSSIKGVKVEGKADARKDYVATEFKEEARPEPVREAPKKSEAKGAQKVYMDELERTLNELYALNEKIEDEAVSQRIDRIGELTAGIFRAVIDNPAREQDVRKFMNYYLPTTLKLLKSYEMLEEQSYQGENIAESRKKIENVLDMLIQAYEKQLDRLFHDDALDIATDIDVLETMMAGDGLSQKGQLHL